MIKLTEFYPERQGRPDSKVALDMDSREPAIPYGYITGVMLTAAYSSIEQTENYTAAGYTIIYVDAGTGTVVITLPEASTNNGRYYFIKLVSSGGSVKIQGDDSAETIDGEVSIKLDSQYQYVMVHCTGEVWYILGGEYMGLEATMKKLLNELIDLSRQTLTEAEQSTLYLDDIAEKPSEAVSVRDYSNSIAMVVTALEELLGAVKALESVIEGKPSGEVGQALTELKQIKLHLVRLSGESIEEDI